MEVLDIMNAMTYFFYTLPKILFFPVYIAVWGALPFLFAAACKTLYDSRGRNAKSIMVIVMTLGIFSCSLFTFRSARYVFMMAFPLTFMVAVFVTNTAAVFPRCFRLLLFLFTAAFVAGNTLKTFHVDPHARFYDSAVKKLQPYLRGVNKDDVLLVGDSQDLGRIAYKAGLPFCGYPYPIEDAKDLELLKEHFRDKYKVMFLLHSNKYKYSCLTEPTFSVSKSKQNHVIQCYRVDLSSREEILPPCEKKKNLFVNAALDKPMTELGMKRIRQFFADNPEVLKIVDRPDFFWPYAWPFDHAGSLFPRKDFDFRIDTLEDGKRAIHIRTPSPFPFGHPYPFPSKHDYLLCLKMRFLRDGEVSISQMLKDAKSKVLYFGEIKEIAGKAGEVRSFRIPVCPGKVQHISREIRDTGTVFFSFLLKYGEVQFSDFELFECPDRP